MTSRLSRRALLRASGLAFGTGIVAQPTAAQGNGTDPDRFIVGTASPAAQRSARRGADAVVRELDFGPIGSCVVGRFPQAAREALEKRADVSYVEPDLQLALLGQEVDWGVERIGATETGDATGDDAHVTIIDTGIDPNHETLAENLGEGYAPVPCDSCAEPWGDTHGHGTGVAGVVGAADNGVGTVGVAPDCTLHAARVMDGETGAFVSDIAAALEWTADQGHDVANMSLGADITSQTLENACAYAYENDVLLVSSAGNAGDADSVTVPAAYETVVAVGAIDRDDDLAWFSSMGPEVELTAPGVAITVPDIGDEYSARSGTSFASPHVAGTAALVFSSGATRTEARSHMRATSEDLGLEESEQGEGLVRADRAVDGEWDGSDDDDEETGDEDSHIAVATGEAIAVDEDSATLTGELVELKGHDAATVYFEWGEHGDELSKTTTERTIDGTDEFEATVTGLEDGTEYEFQAVAEAGDEADTGEVATFVTASDESDDEIDARPKIDRFDLHERNAGPWTRVRISWEVSHDDGTLESVETTVEGMGTETTAVSGDEASDHHDHRERNGGGTYDVTLTVTDTAGNTTRASKPIDL